jgi:hypothetical protein
MRVGFTGTRRGMTEAQVMAMHTEVLGRRVRPSVWLHGGCVGADEDSVVAVRLWQAPLEEPPPAPVRVVALPGRSASGPATHDLQSEAAIRSSDEVRAVDTHFARNRRIVEECEVLVACPATMAEAASGGTWYTVNQARRAGRRVIIVWPDGSVTEEARCAP